MWCNEVPETKKLLGSFFYHLYVLILLFLYQSKGHESIVLPASIRVSVIISDFCLRVYTCRQNNPRTKVRTLVNVKMPLKAHGNNVTLESM